MTAIFAVTAVTIFVNDTRHAYDNMLESMKRHAETSPNMIVERKGFQGSSLQGADPIGAGYATRTSIDLNGLVMPTE